MRRYIVTFGGERIDRIARAIYGTELGGTVEALLDANPGLAAHGPIVPEGVVISVPETVVTAPAAGHVLAWE